MVKLKDKTLGACPERNRRVFVGMSGGVDSSVSAALLQKEGYEVTGVFIKTWSPDWLPCTWREERRDAMRVAAKLKIPLLTLDLEKEYKGKVVDYMIAEYRAGRVPNPDGMCNKVIKFGGFFDFAINNGADFVATGHYAGVSKEQRIPFSAHGKRGEFATKITSNSPKSIVTRLMTSADKLKDQTYFLWMLTQRELSKTLFPIGNLQKSEVRKLAKKFGLPNAEKKDSQGLCFMGKIVVKDFLKHYIKEKPGKVLNEDGDVIGEHEGVTFYTIGQRHGFSINSKTPEDLPWFVISKDIKKNTITVSHEKISEQNNARELFIENINWCEGMAPNLSKKYSARIRYRQPLQTCQLYLEVEPPSKNRVYRVVFNKPQESIAPGQSVVVYDKNVCLGGGVILPTPKGRDHRF